MADFDLIFETSEDIKLKLIEDPAKWGAISGNLSDQGDLQLALDNKYSKLGSYTHNGLLKVDSSGNIAQADVRDVDVMKKIDSENYVQGNIPMMGSNGRVLVDSEVSASSVCQKPQSATTGNVAVFDSNRNVTDGGFAPASASGLALTDRRVDALYKVNEGQTYDFDVDTADCYSAPVPSGSVADSVKSIGGKSLVINQLCRLNNGSGTTSGITYAVSNGILTLNGTATSNFTVSSQQIPVVNQHKYLMIGCPSGGSWSSYYLTQNQTWSADWGSGNIFTANATGNIRLDIGIVSGTTVSNLVFRPQLIDLTQMFGSSLADTLTVAQVKAILPKSYYAYNTGTIINGGTKRVDVYGKNLFNKNGDISKNHAGVDITGQYANVLNSDGNIVVNLSANYQYTVGQIISIKQGDTITMSGSCINFGNSSALNMMVHELGNTLPVAAATMSNLNQRYSCNFTASKDMDVVFGFVTGGGAVPSGAIVSDVQVEKSASATVYSPYHIDSTTIPNSIQSLEGYGQSNIGGSVYNYVDYANRKYHYFGKYVNGSWVSSSEVVTDLSSMLDEGFLQAMSVEGGGSVTFVSDTNDDYRIPVNNTNEFIVRLANV